MTPSFKRGLIAACVALPVLGMTIWPAAAQPQGDQPAGERPAGGPGGPGGRRGPGSPFGGGGAGERGQRSEWVQKYATELREHPRMARALVALHETKDYMEKSGEDFGGTKAQTIKDIDAAIKSVEASMKHDPKREPPAGGPDGERPEGRGRGPRGGGGPGGEGQPGGKPSDK